MEKVKELEYLQNLSKYRADKEALSKGAALSHHSGISVHQDRPKILLQDSQLYRLLSKNELLIRISRPLLNKTFDHFTDKTHLLVLTDSQGYVVDLVSSPEILLTCFHGGIQLGACLSHFSYGTNGFSVAMQENRPVTLLGQEHYCNSLKAFHCAAVPIKKDTETIGFLSISSVDARDLLQLTSLVIVLSELIEVNIKYFQLQQQLQGEHSTPFPKNNRAFSDKETFYGRLMVSSQADLTVKEIEILYLLWTHKTPPEIIKELGVSKNTIKTHMKNIYQKLAVSNLTDCLQRIQGLLALELKNEGSALV